eukprot:9495615-Pyramimonas_sp.AAC.1
MSVCNADAALAEEGEDTSAQDAHVSTSQELYAKPKLAPQVASRPRTQGGPLVPRSYLGQSLATKTLPGNNHGPARPPYKQAYQSPSRAGPKGNYLVSPVQPLKRPLEYQLEDETETFFRGRLTVQWCENTIAHVTFHCNFFGVASFFVGVGSSLGGD